MRKLITICLMMVMGFASNAQTKGPAKEETIAFIKGYFSDLKIDSQNGKDYYLYNDQYKITIENARMLITWKNYNFSNEFNYNTVIEFDLKDINQLTTYKNKTSWDCENGIFFNTVNNTKSIKETTDNKVKMVSGFSLSIYRGSDCVDVKTTQIYKAFNHLRKLCGAPEPISFD